MKTTVLTLGDLTCGHCVARVKKTLEAIPGVESAEVTQDKAVIVADVEEQCLIQAIIDAGYQAKLADEAK